MKNLSELEYWLWLSGKTGVRPHTKIKLIESLGDPKSVYRANSKVYQSLGVSSVSELKQLLDKDLKSAEMIYSTCLSEKISIVTLADAQYPKRLTSIYDPPIVIYYKGNLPLIDSEALIAFAGTRKASAYGLNMAYRLGRDVCRGGGAAACGLTDGTDRAAAKGAIDAGGIVITVLGTAINAKQSEKLSEIAESCTAVISEYPPGTKTLPTFFRARNRITAGLSLAAVVVEAPKESGALLFADEALAQGKEIYAVTANADCITAEGSNALIKDGAIPVTGAWDILSAYSSIYPDKLKEPTKENAVYNMPESKPKMAKNNEQKTKSERIANKKGIDNENHVAYIDLKAQLNNLSENQLKIISAIKKPGTHIDEIIESSGLKTSDTVSELIFLQIEGYVSREAGNRYSLKIIQSR